LLSNSVFPDLCGDLPPVNPIPILYPNLTPVSLPHANHIDGQPHTGNKKALTAQKISLKMQMVKALSRSKAQLRLS
jgi:hypothetical protein